MVGDRHALVLIIERDRRVRRALRALVEVESDLALCGAVSCAASALAAVRATPPTVILLGLHLPTEEEGLALLANLAHWPVVALSTQGRLREAALQAGAVTFLEQGAAPEVLLATLRAAISDRGVG